MLGRFTSPDSIVPDITSSFDWNRYSYVRNNYTNSIDPSGHVGCSDIPTSYNYQIREDCHIYSEASVGELTRLIEDKFGVEMVSVGRQWSIANTRTAYMALDLINDELNNNLKSLLEGTQFVIDSKDINAPGDYSGLTYNNKVVYFTKYSYTTPPLINFLHETGHLLDFVPATYNVFSDPLDPNKGGATPSWVIDGYVNFELLGDLYKEPVQAKPMNEPYDPYEYWADAFGNYFAGNIDLAGDETGEALEMYNYVKDALSPYAKPNTGEN